MRKKILLITRNFRINGGKRAGESFIGSLTSRLSKHRNFKISILSIDDETRDGEESYPGLSVTRVLSSFVSKGIPASRFFTEFWLKGEKRTFVESFMQKNIDLIRIMKEAESDLSEVDIIHWFDMFSPLVKPFILLSKLYGINNYLTQFSFWKKYPLNNLLYKASLSNFDQVITTTKSLASFNRTEIGLRTDKVRHIPLGIDLNLYRPPSNKGDLKEKRGIGEDHKIISWFGPIENCTFDDFRYLLFSTRKVHERVPTSVFFFCFKDTVPDCVHPVGDYVKFINDLSDIREILRMTDIVVLPGTLKSRHIGLPLTIIEAIATGVPAITIKNRGVDEVIVDGFNGILTKRLDEIPEAIINLCKQENKLIEMSRNSRAFAEKQFNIENVTQAYVNLWER